LQRCNRRSTPSFAGGSDGRCTEWTQLANNAELIKLLEKLRPAGRQPADPDQPAGRADPEPAQHLREHAAEHAQLPDHIWGQVESDLNQLRSIVDQGQSIAFSMGNADDVLKQRFKSYADLKTNLPNNGRPSRRLPVGRTPTATRSPAR
jgi:conjugal transfer/entry exclusion protein